MLIFEHMTESRMTMYLTADSKEATNIIVFLNGKPIVSYIAAEEGKEGWVEIVDIASMAPLDLEEDNVAGDEEDLEVEFSELKTKKLYGEVEFKKLS